MRNKVITAKDTVIERYKPTTVGKRVSNHLYLHQDYALEAMAILKRIDPDLGGKLEASLAWKVREFPASGFRCLRFDLNSGTIRFDEAPDFDSSREPVVGWWLTVNPDGSANKGWSEAIWHHKWLWVKDDYQGFDVAASRAWSAKYAPLLKGPPKGSQRSWLAQLAEVGLS